MTRELAGKLLLFGLSLKTDARGGRPPRGVKELGQPCRTSYSCHLPDRSL
jgi:hypothetical protein